MQVEELITQLEHIYAEMKQREASYVPTQTQVHDRHKRSVQNLLHYLSLRTFDLRKFHDELSVIGVSSLRYCEAYTLSSILNILRILYSLSGKINPHKGEQPPLDLKESRALLHDNTHHLLGAQVNNHDINILVTLPVEASSNYQLVYDLVNNGMDCARINCGHDDAHVWQKMVDHVRKAEKETGKKCFVYFDLAGPKLRTARTQNDQGYYRLSPGDEVLFVEDIKAFYPDYHKVYSLTLPEVIQDVQVGEPIWFNDGKLGGEIISVKADQFAVKMTFTEKDRKKLKEDKGINLPQTNLSVPSLTHEDLGALEFAVQYGDIVGYSFVREASDVALIQQKLAEMGRPEMGLVLKIETLQAFNNLPHLLLQLMQSPNIGVMVARGDLAVEIGFERSAEAQEEILWLCEAAHIPCIWATQVLHSLAKTGLATRSEITDAAMAARAECVMLNTGEHMVDSLKMLNGILTRMHNHTNKRIAIMRPLSVAKNFFPSVR